MARRGSSDALNLHYIPSHSRERESSRSHTPGGGDERDSSVSRSHSHHHHHHHGRPNIQVRKVSTTDDGNTEEVVAVEPPHPRDGHSTEEVIDDVIEEESDEDEPKESDDNEDEDHDDEDDDDDDHDEVDNDDDDDTGEAGKDEDEDEEQAEEDELRKTTKCGGIEVVHWHKDRHESETEHRKPLQVGIGALKESTHAVLPSTRH